MMKNNIRLEEVKIKSDGKIILDAGSLLFPEGKTTVIIGPSGCGKSLLLKTAGGILFPTSGSVYWGGENLFKISESRNRQIRCDAGFVFQDAALWANETILQNLVIPATFQKGLKNSQAVDLARQQLKEFGISEFHFHHRPSALSFGEQKLVSFLRASLIEPKKIFLDDPTLSVDTNRRSHIINSCIRFRKQKMTQVICTHDTKLIAQTADRLIVMKDGKILTEGLTHDVGNCQHKEVVFILDEILDRASFFDQDILDILDEDF